MGSVIGRERRRVWLVIDRPYLPLRDPAGDPTPITQVKVRTRAKSITVSHFPNRFPVLKPVTGSRLTSLLSSYCMSGTILTNVEWLLANLAPKSSLKQFSGTN